MWFLDYVHQLFNAGLRYLKLIEDRQVGWLAVDRKTGALGYGGGDCRVSIYRGVQLRQGCRRSYRIHEEMQREGHAVEKGDEIGLFQFGGSSILVAFEAGRIEFDRDLERFSLEETMGDESGESDESEGSYTDG